MQKLTKTILNNPARNNLFSNRQPTSRPQYPIIQAPMAGGILSPQVISKIANNGFFANIASGYLNIKSLQEFIATTKQLLNNQQYPLGVNVFIDSNQHLYSKEIFRKTPTILELEQLLGINMPNRIFSPEVPTEADYIDAIISNSIAVASCTFGFFNGYSVEKLKGKGIKIIGNATCLQELSYCVQSGADAVVVQGAESGGHQASFLTEEKNLNSTIDLLQQARQLYPKLTIIAAGGISANNAYNYFQQGADYVQLGTAFMMTYESNVPEIAKRFINDHKHDTVITNSITGKYARGVSNNLIKTLEQSNLQNHDDIYQFPLGHYATAVLRAKAKELKKPEYMSLWAGSNPDNLQLKSIDQVIDELKSAFC